MLMAMTSSDLIQARLLISDILDALEIDAYLFEIEPRDGQWELKVECAVEEGWGSYRVALDEAELHAGFSGEAARKELQEQCRKSLSACRKTAGERK
jgi:hypothetical protein